MKASLSPEQIASFVTAVTQYIGAQREAYYPRAAPLAFGAPWPRYFPRADLKRVRVLEPGKERVQNPPFYVDLEALGFRGLPDFTSMAAITFDDVVVFHDEMTPQLIFHELVHVTQYRLLGVEEFARLYVRGYLHGGYDGTPLEVCAYNLDGRFIMGGGGFDVESEVRGWIQKGLF